MTDEEFERICPDVDLTGKGRLINAAYFLVCSARLELNRTKSPAGKKAYKMLRAAESMLDWAVLPKRNEEKKS